MPDELYPDCRASEWRGLTLCVFLGVLLLTPVCAGAETLVAAQDFDPNGILDQWDVRITLTFNAPLEFATAGGEARLLSSRDSGAEEIKGTFETSTGVAVATFGAERSWEDKSFPFIALFDQTFDLNKPVEVERIQPRTPKVEPDLRASTENAQVFRVTSSEALEDEAALCSDGLSVEPNSLKVTASQASIKKGGLDVQLAIQRPEKEIADATLVLKVCGKSARWAYKSEPLNLRPVLSHALNIEVTHGGDGAVEVTLRPAVVATGSEGEAKVLEGPERLAGLGPDSSVTFRREGDSYLAEVPVDCAVGELILDRLTLLARDDQGDLLLFQHPGGVAVCPPLSLWSRFEANPVAWSLIGSAGLALLGLVGFLGYDVVRSRRSASNGSQIPNVAPSQDPPKTSSKEQIDQEELRKLLSDILLPGLAPVDKGIKELKAGLAELRERIPSSLEPPLPASTKEGWEDRDDLASIVEGGGGASLPALVNRWWRDGADRSRADFLLQSPSVKAYRSVKIHEDMRNLTNRTFTFQVTDGPMEWLGRQQQGDLLLVPCDPRQFEAGDSLKFLGYLFGGLGTNLAKIRFRRVARPCRLRREPSAQDRYRLVEKGLLELEGQSETVSAPLVVQPVALARAPQENLSMATGLSEAKLAKVVRGAVSEVIPGDLSARVGELARQVGFLREREPQKAEPAQPDPRLAAALDGVHRGIGAFEARLQEQATAVREVKSLVEALQGDLLRIEAGLRPTDSPAPAAAIRSLADPVEESEIEAVMDRLREVPAQPPPQEPPFVAETPWRPAGPVHVPQKLLDRLALWWPVGLLPSPDSSPDGDSLPDPSAYLWRLEETRRVLARAGLEKGWQVSLVHLNVPEGSGQSDSLLEILEPVTVSGDYRLAFYRGNPFNDAFLFQFALGVRGDDSRDVAVLPAAGLRVDKHHHAYSRLTLGKLPESAVRIIQVTQPAVLSPAGQGSLYTVASPLKADFR